MSLCVYIYIYIWHAIFNTIASSNKSYLSVKYIFIYYIYVVIKCNKYVWHESMDHVYSCVLFIYLVIGYPHLPNKQNVQIHCFFVASHYLCTYIYIYYVWILPMIFHVAPIHPVLRCLPGSKWMIFSLFAWLAACRDCKTMVSSFCALSMALWPRGLDRRESCWKLGSSMVRINRL